MIFYAITDQESETIMLNTLENNAPITGTTTDKVKRDVPLQVNFIENNLSDNIGSVRYYRKFHYDLSSVPNTFYSFINP